MSLVNPKLNYILIGIMLTMFRVLHRLEAYQNSLTNELNNVDVPNSATLNPKQTPEVRCGGNYGCNCDGGCGCCGDGCWGNGGSGDGVYVYPVYVPVVYIVDNNAGAGTGAASNSFGASTEYAGNAANGGYGNIGCRSGYESGCRCGYNGGSECCNCNCGNGSYCNCGYGNGCYDNCGCCGSAYG